LHETEQRLARWLLMGWDRTQETDLNFTQEYLAELSAPRSRPSLVICNVRD
jgi:hypothetical protein